MSPTAQYPDKVPYGLFQKKRAEPFLCLIVVTLLVIKSQCIELFVNETLTQHRLGADL